MVGDLQLEPREGATCPLCRSEVEAEDRQVCESCQTSYHPACLDELGGCSTLGCPAQGRRPARRRPQPRVVGVPERARRPEVVGVREGSRDLPDPGEEPTAHELRLCVLIGLVAVAFAVLFVHAAVVGPGMAMVTLEWTPTPCTIEDSGISVSKDKEGNFSVSFWVSYAYEAGGESRTGTRVDYRLDRGHYTDVMALEARFLKGSRSECYVNPDDPEDAVLLRGPDARPSPFSTWFFGGAGLVCFLGAMLAAARRYPGGGWEHWRLTQVVLVLPALAIPLAGPLLGLYVGGRRAEARDVGLVLALLGAPWIYALARAPAALIVVLSGGA